jgi:hypothetical protein
MIDFVRGGNLDRMINHRLTGRSRRGNGDEALHWAIHSFREDRIFSPVFQAAREDRTPDLLITNQPLYQLSYGGIRERLTVVGQ